MGKERKPDKTSLKGDNVALKNLKEVLDIFINRYQTFSSFS